MAWDPFASHYKVQVADFEVQYQQPSGSGRRKPFEPVGSVDSRYRKMGILLSQVGLTF